MIYKMKKRREDNSKGATARGEAKRPPTNNKVLMIYKIT